MTTVSTRTPRYSPLLAELGAIGSDMPYEESSALRHLICVNWQSLFDLAQRLGCTRAELLGRSYLACYGRKRHRYADAKTVVSGHKGGSLWVLDAPCTYCERVRRHVTDARLNDIQKPRYLKYPAFDVTDAHGMTLTREEASPVIRYFELQGGLAIRAQEIAKAATIAAARLTEQSPSRRPDLYAVS